MSVFYLFFARLSYIRDTQQQMWLDLRSRSFNVETLCWQNLTKNSFVLQTEDSSKTILEFRGTSVFWGGWKSEILYVAKISLSRATDYGNLLFRTEPKKEVNTTCRRRNFVLLCWRKKVEVEPFEKTIRDSAVVWKERELALNFFFKIFCNNKLTAVRCLKK